MSPILTAMRYVMQQRVVLKNIHLSNSAEILEKLITKHNICLKRHKLKTSISHEPVLSGTKGLMKV